MRITAYLFLAVFMVSCSQLDKGFPENGWSENMQQLVSTLTEILPFAFNKSKFEDRENRKVVREKIKQFADNSHQIRKEKALKLFGEDPLVTFSLHNLNQELMRSLEAFDRGNYRYSRNLLQHSINYCFACHTRTPLGPEYDYWNLKTLANTEINHIQKARIMVATRQFDKARDILKDYIEASAETVEDPFVLERSIKQYLAIAVRVEGSPQEAYDFISRISEYKLPLYLARNMESWKASLSDWMIENKKKHTGIEEARRLVGIPSLSSKIFQNEDQYVDYLRASYTLHDELLRKLSNAEKAEIYYLLGAVYNTLIPDDTVFWQLPENYFEACIRHYPKTKQSRKCYQSLESNIVLDYTGSAGTFIPLDDKKRLAELRELSGY